MKINVLRGMVKCKSLNSSSKCSITYMIMLLANKSISVCDAALARTVKTLTLNYIALGIWSLVLLEKKPHSDLDHIWMHAKVSRKILRN